MPTKKANFFCSLAGDFFPERFLRYSVGRASGVFLAENVLKKGTQLCDIFRFFHTCPICASTAEMPFRRKFHRLWERSSLPIKSYYLILNFKKGKKSKIVKLGLIFFPVLASQSSTFFSANKNAESHDARVLSACDVDFEALFLRDAMASDVGQDPSDPSQTFEPPHACRGAAMADTVFDFF